MLLLSLSLSLSRRSVVVVDFKAGSDMTDGFSEQIYYRLCTGERSSQPETKLP